jgi:glutamate racemase
MAVQQSELIGLFDSGLGGLTVLRELQGLMPTGRFIYLGDVARLPYGTKSPETILRYSRECAEFLQKRHCSVIVIACNTVSAIALDRLSQEIPVPVLGAIQPAVNDVLAQTKSGRIGVLATDATVASGVYEAALQRGRPDVVVLSQACPLFVPLVEAGMLTGHIVQEVVSVYCAPLKAAGVDTVVLGCTHYPLLAPEIQAFFGSDVAIIESSKSLAETVYSFCQTRPDTLNSQATLDTASCEFCVTDDVGRFNYLANTFLPSLSVTGGIRAQRVEL